DVYKRQELSTQLAIFKELIAFSVREIIRTSLQPVRIGSISREKAQKTKMKLLPVTQVSGIM
ncbi:hypothetical protein QQG62_21660, partial [Klebsiella pneumoniae]|uniref:hypothetical protein n=1 Tax=Klebsiella pneumoniae TaxID=573 RepID=UPI003458D291